MVQIENAASQAIKSGTKVLKLTILRVFVKESKAKICLNLLQN